MKHKKRAKPTRPQRIRYAERKRTIDAGPVTGPRQKSGCREIERELLDELDANFVETITTPLVRGLVCAKDGRLHGGILFPGAPWLVNKQIESDLFRTGFYNCGGTGERQRAQVALLENCGIMIAANSIHAIGEQRKQIVDKLTSTYRKAGIDLRLNTCVAPASSCTETVIRQLFGHHAEVLISTGLFAYAQGDVIKHEHPAASIPFSAPLSLSNIKNYVDSYGAYPNVVVTGDRIYGLGEEEQKARAALNFAMESALSVQFAAAFGGVHYLTPKTDEAEAGIIYKG